MTISEALIVEQRELLCDELAELYGQGLHTPDMFTKLNQACSMVYNRFNILIEEFKDQPSRDE